LFTLAIAQAVRLLGLPPPIVGLKLVEKAPAPLRKTFLSAPKLGALRLGLRFLKSAILFFKVCSTASLISISPAFDLVEAVPAGFALLPFLRSLAGAGVWLADFGPGRLANSFFLFF
jgi:hypothetical protein